LRLRHAEPVPLRTLYAVNNQPGGDISPLAVSRGSPVSNDPLAHEVIHAEMFRKLMALAGEPNFEAFSRQELIDLLSDRDYLGTYNYYRK